MSLTTLTPDLCIFGGGTGGLVVAAGAVQMGASVVLIERHRMGGDCLNTGCVPSKALIAAAGVAATMRGAGAFGIAPVEPDVDFAAVQDHVRRIIEGIAPHDSIERFERLGVQVLTAHAAFTGPDEVLAGHFRIRARRFVVATGSAPAMPPVPGLAATPHFTNETIFENRVRPEHLIVLGGGPIGVELAQAHRRLGSAVTILQKGSILPKDDPELVAVVRERLRAEGIEIRENVAVAEVARSSATGPAGDMQAGVRVVLGGAEVVTGSHLLVAAGRRAVVAGLGLDRAGVRVSTKGIETDRRLRTSNRQIFAVGDVTGRQQFTHVAAHHAGIVLRNALFRLPAKIEERAVPWVTYTDPELAHVGTTEAAIHAAGRTPTVLRFAFGENDRARTARAGEGLIKVVTDRRGRVLGASIVGEGAGELLLPWVLAVRDRARLGSIASAIVPYPTLSEASKSVAGAYYAPKLFSCATRKLVRLLARFG